MLNPHSSSQTIAAPATRTASRWGPLQRAATLSDAELAVLFAAGSLAATAVAFLHLGLRIPGHKIVLAVRVAGTAIVCEEEWGFNTGSS